MSNESSPVLTEDAPPAAPVRVTTEAFQNLDLDNPADLLTQIEGSLSERDIHDAGPHSAALFTRFLIERDGPEIAGAKLMNAYRHTTESMRPQMLAMFARAAGEFADAPAPLSADNSKTADWMFLLACDGIAANETRPREGGYALLKAILPLAGAIPVETALRSFYAFESDADLRARIESEWNFAPG